MVKVVDALAFIKRRRFISVTYTADPLHPRFGEFLNFGKHRGSRPITLGHSRACRGKIGEYVNLFRDHGH